MRKHFAAAITGPTDEVTIHEITDRHQAGVELLKRYRRSRNMNPDICRVLDSVTAKDRRRLNDLGWFTSDGHEWVYRPDLAGQSIVLLK